MTERGDIVERALPPLPKNTAGDYERIDAMIAMRDGVKLATTMIIPKGAIAAPIILDRTPYSDNDILGDPAATCAADLLHPLHRVLFEAGYILAIQQVRGKHGSQGVYEMNRPVRGAWNKNGTDHVTDGWDTVDWLVANTPQGNGRVGALGLSYDGFAALMQLIDPHPALVACVALSPMVDNWVGDDWFRGGVFHQQHALHYVNRQTSAKAGSPEWPSPAHDEYDAWLAAGSAHGMAEKLGFAGHPAWQRFEQHPAYDEYWQTSSLALQLEERSVPVPALHVHGQWDVDDPYGPIAAFTAIERSTGGGANNHLVSGPWSHAGAFFTDGTSLGPLNFGTDTAAEFRRDILLPFLDAFLKHGLDVAPIAKISAFPASGTGWQHFDEWPVTEAKRRLYLSDGFALSDRAPVQEGADIYISDPSTPVTHRPRPILRKDAPGFIWEEMGVLDQRFAGDRPDVLRYASAPLDAPLLIAGLPSVQLTVSTSANDADWFVTLIDAWPDSVPDQPEMGGYQLPIARQAIRGRFIADRAQATPLTPDQPITITLDLPSVAYTVRPGHRLMLHIQSTMFPAFDRNPQRFVPNIFFAKPEDYVTATQSVYRGPVQGSWIDLPFRR